MDSNTARITEAELRAGIKEMLAVRAEKEGARLYEELSIEKGVSRIDLALVGDRMEGFELKSDYDNFSRLHNQIHAYNRVFDRITIVTGSVSSEGALNVLPKWWGVVLAERDGVGLKFKELRPACDNALQDPYSVATLLWRDEAIALLKESSSRVPSKASSTQLYALMADNLPLEQIRTGVARLLLERGEPVTA